MSVSFSISHLRRESAKKTIQKPIFLSINFPSPLPTLELSIGNPTKVPFFCSTPPARDSDIQRFRDQLSLLLPRAFQMCRTILEPGRKTIVMEERLSRDVEPEPMEDDAGDDKKETKTQMQKTETQTELAQLDSSQNHVVFSSGGEEGRSGVPNAILIIQFDSASVSLSNQPLAKLNTGSALPYRMTVHPAGSDLVCSFLHSCKWFELEEESDEVPKLALRQSERVLEQLQDIGQQLALAFDRESSMLAAGDEHRMAS
ncbi:hypothetical protein ACFX2H_043857 [Malus domestica]